MYIPPYEWKFNSSSEKHEDGKSTDIKMKMLHFDTE